MTSVSGSQVILGVRETSFLSATMKPERTLIVYNGPSLRVNGVQIKILSQSHTYKTEERKSPSRFGGVSASICVPPAPMVRTWYGQRWTVVEWIGGRMAPFVPGAATVVSSQRLRLHLQAAASQVNRDPRHPDR